MGEYERGTIDAERQEGTFSHGERQGGTLRPYRLSRDLRRHAEDLERHREAREVGAHKVIPIGPTVDCNPQNVTTAGQCLDQRVNRVYLFVQNKNVDPTQPLILGINVDVTQNPGAGILIPADPNGQGVGGSYERSAPNYVPGSRIFLAALGGGTVNAVVIEA